MGRHAGNSSRSTLTLTPNRDLRWWTSWKAKFRIVLTQIAGSSMRITRNVTTQTSLTCGSLTVLLLILTLAQTPTALSAGLEAGVGGNCSDVKQQIRRDWFSVKKFFQPNSENLKRPRSRDFFCISPAYAREAFPQRSGSISLKCYVIQGQHFCCDSRLQACAGL